MYHTDAIVLDIIDFGEYDQLVSLYTKEFGKVHAKVRSAKKITTKQANFLHTPSVLNCSLVLGRQGYILSGVTRKSAYDKIFSDLFALGYILSFLNFVNSVTYQNQKDNKIWRLLVQALGDAQALIKNNNKEQMWFKEKEWILQFLEILGLGEKINMEKINNKKQFNYYLKNILENKLEQKVQLFGFN